MGVSCLGLGYCRPSWVQVIIGLQSGHADRQSYKMTEPLSFQVLNQRRLPAIFGRTRLFDIDHIRNRFSVFLVQKRQLPSSRLYQSNERFAVCSSGNGIASSVQLLAAAFRRRRRISMHFRNQISSGRIRGSKDVEVPFATLPRPTYQSARSGGRICGSTGPCRSAIEDLVKRQQRRVLRDEICVLRLQRPSAVS